MSFRRASKPVPVNTSSSVPIPQSSQAKPLPPNVYTSIASALKVTSAGHYSLDTLFGGGLPLGTVTLVTQDFPTSYHHAFSLYFLAQGLASSHAIIVYSFDHDCEQLLSRIPSQADASSTSAQIPYHHRSQQPDLKIAWRYTSPSALNPQRVLPSSNRLVHAQQFDLSLPPQQVKTNRNIYPVQIPFNSDNCLNRIIDQIQQYVNHATDRKLLPRILVTEIGPDCSQDSLCRFISRLRAIALVSGAVVLITCALETPQRALSSCVDAHIVLNSFNGRGAGVAGLGSEWLGILSVRKTFRDSNAIPIPGRGDVWVFKRGRRKFSFERATAAPDMEDESPNQTYGSHGADDHENVKKVNGARKSTSVVCGSGPGPSPLDF